MKSKIVADGSTRFQFAKNSLPSVESVRLKYARLLANATAAEKEKIEEQMARELRRRETTTNHQPSAGTLW